MAVEPSGASWPLQARRALQRVIISPTTPDTPELSRPWLDLHDRISLAIHSRGQRVVLGPLPTGLGVADIPIWAFLPPMTPLEITQEALGPAGQSPVHQSTSKPRTRPDMRRNIGITPPHPQHGQSHHDVKDSRAQRGTKSQGLPSEVGPVAGADTDGHAQMQGSLGHSPKNGARGSYLDALKGRFCQNKDIPPKWAASCHSWMRMPVSSKALEPLAHGMTDEPASPRRWS